MTQQERSERFKAAWEGTDTATKPSQKTKKGSMDTSTSAKVLANLERRLEIETRPIFCIGSDWFRYGDGCANPVDRNIFRKEAWKVQPADTANSRRVRELLDCLEAKHQLEEGERLCHCTMQLDLENPAEFYLVNCGNRVLKIRRLTGEIVDNLEHSHVYRFTTKLTGHYKPELLADGGWKRSCFYKKLHEVLPDDKDKELLLDAFASALLWDDRFEIVVFIIGSGLNGKGLIVNALRHAFGSSNISALTVKQISDKDNGKQIHRLRDKVLNIANELNDEMIQDTTKMKNIASHDVIASEKIYKDGFDFAPRCLQVYSMNFAPRIKSATPADIRRMRIINFGVDCSKAKDASDGINELLQADADIIITHLIQRLARVRRLKEMGRGGKVSAGLLQTISVKNDLIGEFIKKAIVIGEGGPTRSSDLYLAFRNMAIEHNRGVESEIAFFSKLLERKPELRGMKRRFKKATPTKSLQWWGYRAVSFTAYGQSLIKGRQL